MNQRSRAQSRAKSGAPDAVNRETKAEEIRPASFSGRAQINRAGVEIKSCFCGPALDGAAGIGCEPDDGTAQQLILPPQWQPARTGCGEHAGIGAAGNCTPTSNRLNRIAGNRFTK